MSISLLNGRPMPQSEMAVLVQPGDRITVDFIMPHKPVSRGAPGAIARQDYNEHLNACRMYWRQKLDAGASSACLSARR